MYYFALTFLSQLYLSLSCHFYCILLYCIRLYTTDNNNNNNNTNNYYNNDNNNNNIDNNNNTNTNTNNNDVNNNIDNNIDDNDNYFDNNDDNDNLIKFPLTLRSSNIQLFECCHHRNSPPFYLIYFI